MRVLVLHQHYWPEIAATAQLLTDLCEDLAAAGDEVHVVCGQPSYRETSTLESFERRRGVEIHRVWSYRPAKRTIPRRLAHYVSYFSASLARSIATVRPDVVFVMSTPPLLLGASGAFLRALRGTPFVYCVQDLYPDIALDLGVLRPGPLATTIDLGARALYRAARRVVAITESMAVRLTVKGVPPDRIDVVHNWADTSAIRVGERDNAFARRYGLDSRSFVVQYSGNVGRSQGLEHLLDAAETLRSSPVRFAIIGDGDAREGLQQDASRRGLGNVVFVPPQPREQLSESLAASDVGFVPMRRGIGADLMPSKLYGIMAASRPVLAAVDDRSEVARIVRSHGCGFVVAPEDPRALATGIREALERRSDLAELGAAGRRACEDHFSRKAATARYRRVLVRASGGDLLRHAEVAQ